MYLINNVEFLEKNRESIVTNQYAKVCYDIKVSDFYGCPKINKK